MWVIINNNLSLTSQYYNNKITVRLCYRKFKVQNILCKVINSLRIKDNSAERNYCFKKNV